jgi:hypothetical protein
MIALRDLKPQFLRYEKRDDGEVFVHVGSVAEATGIVFLCPKCFTANGGPIGTHSVICWSPAVPPEVRPKPGRWNLVGLSFDDLSLVAGSSSIQLTGGCNWHGFIRDGKATDA